MELANVLASPKLTGLLVEQRSNGLNLDAIIAHRERPHAVTFLQASSMGNAISLMLEAKRGDYFLEYDFIVNDLENNDYPELEDLTTLPIAGVQKIITPNVVCPRSMWGRMTIQKTDGILTDLGRRHKYVRR